MIKWFTKQLLYGRAYLWLKERTEGLLFVIVLIFLISYFHSEYLDYVDFKTKAPDSNIGLSFVIKNILIGLIALGYMYFYFVIKKTKDQIVKERDSSQDQRQREPDKEMVKSLDEFLNDEELKK